MTGAGTISRAEADLALAATASAPASASAAGRGAPDASLPFGRKVALASADYGINLAWHSMELFLLFYYTDVLGLPPIFAGIVLALGSFWDAAIDPVIGALADRTRTRWGRFRPWTVIGSPFIALGLVATFYKPDLAGNDLAAYALLAHLLLRTAYTCASVPFVALSARVTRDPNDRSLLAGMRMQFAGLASLSVALGYSGAVGWFGGGDDTTGFFYAAIGVGLLVILVLTTSMALTREPREDAAEPVRPRLGVKAAVREDWAAFRLMLGGNKPLLRVLLAMAMFSTAGTLISKTTLLYYKYYALAPEMGRYGLASSALSLMVIAPLWAFIANRTSKRTVWLAASAIAAVGAVGLFLIPPGEPWLALGLLFSLGAGITGQAVMFWAMLPDTVEVNEHRFGQRFEAKTLGIALFARKFTLALNGLLVGGLLSLSGFTANMAQTSETQLALKSLIALVPLGCVILSVWVIWGYRLDRAEHRRLRDEIARRATTATTREAGEKIKGETW